MTDATTTAPVAATTTPTPAPTPAPAATPKAEKVTMVAKAEAPTTEAPPPPVEAPKVEVPKEKLATRAAQIKERERQAAILEANAKKTLADAEEKVSLLKKIKENPSKVLEAAGISFEDLAVSLLAEGKPVSPEQQALKEAQEARREIEEMKRAQEAAIEEKHKAIVDKAIADYQAEVVRTVQANAEKYEFVSTYEATGLVMDITKEYWKKHQKVLDVGEALDAAEAFLEKRADKLANMKKIRSRIETATKPTESPTLTNKMTAFSAAVGEKTALLSREDRLKAAAAKLKYS